MRVTEDLTRSVNNQIAEGGHGQQISSNLEAFFHGNGITKVPNVLILHRFNDIPKESTYSIKPLLLDLNSRGDSEVFSTMRQVVLTCDAAGVDLDDVLRRCIHTVIAV